MKKLFLIALFLTVICGVARADEPEIETIIDHDYLSGGNGYAPDSFKDGAVATTYSDGWENRDHNTTLVLDFKKHEKRYRDVETKQIVKTEAFGPGDEQRRFV